MPWVLHQHLVCVAVRKYVATLADVVNVRKHKFHGKVIEYVAATLSDALGATQASGLCCYALWLQGPSNLTPHDLELGAKLPVEA